METKGLRILVLSFYFRPDLSAGSFRTTAFVDALEQKMSVDGQIDVLTTLPNRYSSFSVDAPAEEKAPGLSIVRIALPPHQSGMFDQARAFISFAREVSRHTRGQKYDLVFATSSRLMTAVLGAWVARNSRIPLYLDIRDIFVDTIKDVLPKHFSVLAKPVFAVLERWAINSASKVNLVSQGFSEYFSARFPRQRFSYFSNGIDDEFLSLPIPESVPRTNDVVEVLYAGNLGEGQGLHAIVPDLAKRMHGKIRFKIIGDGGRKEVLRAALVRADIDNVEMLPPMKRAQLIEAYQAADVLFLHLNDYDAFRKVLPSKLFEYGAMGKPIWAGVSGYAAEFMRTELDNSAVFHPCNAVEAELVFGQLRLQNQPRARFAAKFARINIANEMANDVVNMAGWISERQERFMTPQLLITGATGFVGKAVGEQAMRHGLAVKGALRIRGEVPSCIEPLVVGEINVATDWCSALRDVNAVVHLAARVHVMHYTEENPLDAFRAVNVEGTVNLARQAAAAGIKRFVFISSVKVNGESTAPGGAFTESDAPNPQDAYGQSKHEAEIGLRQIAAETGMEVVIIRPPLVYGPGVKANFAALMRAVQRGWPLPLGSVHNKRSLVALDNLVDFIITCITHPKAANQTFLVSDGQDLSTTELVRGMAQAAGVPARLLPVPVWALQTAGKLLGKGDAVQRLCGNLQVDISKARRLLGWNPPVSVDEGLRRALRPRGQC